MINLGLGLSVDLGLCRTEQHCCYPQKEGSNVVGISKWEREVEEETIF